MGQFFVGWLSQVESCLKDKNNSTLKLETLLFFKTVLQSHDASVLQPHVSVVCPVLVACISEEWYKIVAEALRVVSPSLLPKRPHSDNTIL